MVVIWESVIRRDTNENSSDVIREKAADLLFVRVAVKADHQNWRKAFKVNPGEEQRRESIANS